MIADVKSDNRPPRSTRAHRTVPRGSVPVKVLHVAKRIDSALGGAPASARNMASAEVEHGFAVTMAATSTPNGSGRAHTEWVDGLPVLLFPRNPLIPYDYSYSMHCWLRRNLARFDLVEIHGVFDFPSVLTSAIARRTRTPYLVHPHNQLDPWDLKKHRLLKSVVGPMIIRRTIRGAERLVTGTPMERDRLRTYGARPQCAVVPLPYLVVSEGADPTAFRAQHGLAGDQIILFLGRIDHQKGLGFLIDAFEKVARALPNVRLVIAGDNDSAYGRTLLAVVHEKRLAARVKFVGHLEGSDKASAFACADLFALISDHESYGLGLVEAAWWGLPMVISSEIYIADQIASAGAGLIVPQDPEVVADTLLSLLRDPHKRDVMGQRGKDLARGPWSWAACSEAHVALRHSLFRN